MQNHCLKKTNQESAWRVKEDEEYVLEDISQKNSFPQQVFHSPEKSRDNVKPYTKRDQRQDDKKAKLNDMGIGRTKKTYLE